MISASVCFLQGFAGSDGGCCTFWWMPGMQGCLQVLGVRWAHIKPVKDLRWCLSLGWQQDVTVLKAAKTVILLDRYGSRKSGVMEKSAMLDKVLWVLLTGTISAPTWRKHRQMRWGRRRGSSNLKSHTFRSEGLMAGKLSPSWGYPVQPKEASTVVMVFTVLQGTADPVLVPLCPVLLWRGTIQTTILIVFGANSLLTPLYSTTGDTGGLAGMSLSEAWC